VFTDRYSEHYTATLGYIHGTEQTGCRYFGGKVSTDSNSDSNSPACFGDFFCGIWRELILGSLSRFTGGAINIWSCG
jgi:hypothetical protein